MHAAGTSWSTIADRPAKVLENANPGPDEIVCRSAAVIGVIPTVTIVTFLKALAIAAAAATSAGTLKSEENINQRAFKRILRRG